MAIKTKMTMDKLASLMKKGFEHTDVQIEKLAISTANSFEKIEERFKGVDEQFDGMDKRFDGIDREIVGLKNQISGVSNRIDDIAENRVKYVDHDKLKRRVEILEKAR